MTGFGPDALAELFALDRHHARWRHDIDYDPACALQMAVLESTCGIRATYHIRTRGPYNPFNADNRTIFHAIAALGHRLAVHVDLDMPRDADTPTWLLSRAAHREHRLLSFEYGLCRSVSFHAPPRSIYGKPLATFDHAFGPGWENRTVSDSRGVWHGDPVAALKGDEPVCLSIHPEWHYWPADKAAEWREIEAAKP